MNDPSSFHGRNAPVPAATPKKTSGKGCLIAVLVVPAVLVVLLVVFLGLNLQRRSEHAREVAAERVEAATASLAAAKASQDVVELSEAQLRQIPPFRRGGTLLREQLIAHLNDDRATELSRSSFIKDTEGLTVAWSMMTREVSQMERGIRGSFEIPYQIRHQNRSRGSTIQVRADFPASARDELIALRRGDWVIVSGKLSFRGDRSPLLSNAEIIEPKE